MLVGDMENAAAVLEEGLLIAVQPSDIAMAYYQLAYVLWKAGRPQAGAACYLKSLMTSSSMAMQATAELQELVEETGVALPPREVVDEELAKHAVPVALPPRCSKRWTPAHPLPSMPGCSPSHATCWPCACATVRTTRW